MKLRFYVTIVMLVSISFIGMLVTSATPRAAAQASGSLFGTGQDGDLVVNAGQVVYTDDARTVVQNAVSGQNSIALLPGYNSVLFQAGQEVLIIQMQGPGAGRYEFGIVANASLQSVTLRDNLTNSYTLGAQVIRVPNYGNVTVAPQGAIAAHPWDGQTGGIVAFRASGTLTMQGTIGTDHIGFRGGISPPGDGSSTNGLTGESFSGPSTASTNPNGGGGAGGCAVQSHFFQGGGGASYGSVGTDGTIGGGAFPCAGAAPPAFGDATLTTAFFLGSGGGSASGCCANGGNGGGGVLLFAQTISLSGAITSRGGLGDPGGNPSAGAGGGSGGSIRLVGGTVNVGTDQVIATGEPGGPGFPPDYGTGGNGGDGRISIQYCDTLSGVTTPAANVQQMACNIPPTVTPPANQSSTEGAATTFNLGSFTDPSAGPWAVDVDWGDGSSHTTFTATATGTLGTQPHTYVDNGSYTVQVTVTNNQSLSAGASFQVNVANVAPAVGPISAPNSPLTVNTSISTSASFTDPGKLDTHTALWDWGDGTTSSGAVTENQGSGSVNGTHSYSAAGVYELKLTVTDKDNGSGQSIFDYVVIFDPNAGFVTGGGWIISPAGAFPANPSLTGKLPFGFDAKYHPGSNIPTGAAQIHFSAANLDFQATGYQWMIINGSRVQLTGTGTMNGSGSYAFSITALDGSQSGAADALRLKIWDPASGQVIYDNQPGAPDTATPTTPLGGGNITIH